MALTTNLVAYWKLDETSGNASDATGNGYTLTNESTATYAAAVINNGVVVDGTNDLTSTAVYAGVLSSNVSIASWIKVTGTGNAKIGFRNDTTGDFYIHIGSTGTTECRFRNSLGTAYTLNPTAGTPSAWHHYAMTYNGSTLTVYIDGTSVATTSATGTMGGTPQYWIGKDSQGLAIASDYDEAAIWARELSSTEVSDLYNSGAGLQYPFGAFEGSTLFPVISPYIQNKKYFKEVPKFGTNAQQVYWNISTSAGANGSISSTASSIFEGDSFTVTLIPNAGYEPLELTLNGSSVPWVTTEISAGVYTYTYPVSYANENYSFVVTFQAVPSPVTGPQLPISFSTSDYGWMSSTLYSAQENSAVRPYVRAKIIDDTLTPMSAIITPSVSGSYADYTNAPDGNVIGITQDVSNNLVFYKTSSVHDATWDSSVILEANSTKWNASAGGNQRFIIRVSDYINGSYHIDIWLLYNLDGSNGSTYAQVRHYYSDDGGTTFSHEDLNTVVGYSSLTALGVLAITAMKPRWNPTTQTVQYGFMYSYRTAYAYSTPVGYICEVNYQWGDSTSGLTETTWTGNMSSYDWTISTIDCQYFNNEDWVVLSAYRNFWDTPNYLMPSGYENYGIFVTKLESPTASSNDVWLTPKEIFTNKSASALNINQFFYPTWNIDGDTARVLFSGRVVESVGAVAATTSEVSTATTIAHLFMIETKDGENFSYPQPMVYANDDYTSYQPKWCSFVKQGDYYYLMGGSVSWEYNAVPTVADISNDIAQYSIQEAAGSPSSITIQLANQNNQWYPNGTNPGASAIAGNRKIVVEQGYYTSTSSTETVPHDVFFIDDIQQQTNYNTNNIVISGRNFYKKLVTTVTKYSKNWFGPSYYVDEFDSTLQNWNQQVGTWTESGNVLTTSGTVSGNIITLANSSPNSYGSYMTVWFKGINTDGDILDFYPLFIDTNNYLRVRLTKNTPSSSIEVRAVYDGTQSYVDSTVATNFPTDTTQYYPMIIRQFDHTKFEIAFGYNTSTSDTTGNKLDAFTSSGLVSNFGVNYFELKTTAGSEPILVKLFQYASSTNATVGLGADVVTPEFKYFSYVKFADSLNIGDAIQHLAAQAGIFDYVLQNDYEDHFFQNNYAGSAVSIVNRNLTLTNTTNTEKAIYGSSTFSNGQITITAYAPAPAGSPTLHGIKILFRADATLNPTNYYTFNLQDDGTFVHCWFSRYYSGQEYKFYPTAYDAGINNGNLNFDMSQPHDITVVFIDSWMTAYIDGIMVAAWNDNNSTTAQTYLTSGYIGVGTLYESDVVVQEIKATSLWKQNPSLSLNAGDNMLTRLSTLAESIRAWFFGDILGRFKVKILSSSDASTYTYQNQIYAQGVNDSNKEFVSQVTVYGNGVQATAKDTSLMEGTPVREAVIVDYTITNQQDAQTRANNELTQANQYQNQYNPKQTMNVGSQLFDAVTVTDTGSNTSNVNKTTRVYADKMNMGGKNNEYSIEIDTGNL